MKKLILFIIAAILLCTGNIGHKSTVANDKSTNAKIRIASSPDLYQLANKWKKEYSLINPSVNLEVVKISELDIAKNLKGAYNFSFVSSKYYKDMDAQSIWQIVIGHDVIVPVFNSNNPLLDQIIENGISPENLAHLFINPEKPDWGTILNIGKDIPVHNYILKDESILSGMAYFMKIDQKRIIGNIFSNRHEMISAIQNDPYAIGFCKITDVADANDLSLLENIQLLPIDNNGNGRIDHYENIYSDFRAFTRGVWIGKYPKTLCSKIYTIALSQPENESEIAFLKWVLTDGQQFLQSNGYGSLAFGESQMKLEKLHDAVVTMESAEDRYSNSKIALLIIIVIAILGLGFSAMIRLKRRKNVAMDNETPPDISVLTEDTVEIPHGLYYDKSHTWAFMEMDGIVKIGIDDFLQHVTGPLTRSILKKSGEKVKKGEQIMTLVQDGKQLNICSPVSGTIKEINEILEIDSSLINSSPYNEGWVYMIEPSNWIREVDFLKMAGSYRQWLINEFARLKDFIAVSAAPVSPKYAHVVLQEGGELKDNVLQNFGPEVWEDFQKHFVDTSQLR